MECSEIRAGFVGYIDGDLSDDERLCVESHVAQCYRCREELDELGRLLELSDAALKHPYPVNRFEDLKKRLADAEPAPIPAALRPKPRLREAIFKLAVATVIIALIAVSPLLVRGAKRLFTPLDGNATLSSGTGVDLPFNLPSVEQKLEMEREVTQWSATGNESEQTGTFLSDQ